MKIVGTNNYIFDNTAAYCNPGLVCDQCPEGGNDVCYTGNSFIIQSLYIRHDKHSKIRKLQCLRSTAASPSERSEDQSKCRLLTSFSAAPHKA